jgi:hypothetical protein
VLAGGRACRRDGQVLPDFCREPCCLCRQAAFEAMDVLLDNARDQLDFPTFVSHLEAGLSVRARNPRWFRWKWKKMIQRLEPACHVSLWPWCGGRVV